MSETELPAAYLFKKDPIEIPPDDPWANDKLGRKEIASQLWTILESVNQPMVMSLSSKYGMGKTTFIDCWRQELKNKDVKTIKFNAWESDFSGDAFGAFIAAFQNEFSNDNKAGEKFKTMSKKVGLSLLKSTPNLLTKIAVRKLTGESIDNFLKDIETDDDEVSSLFGDAVSAIFNGHIEATNAIDSFKGEFGRFIKDECNGKLIVFIDELDRCRPAYAVEVLERIKHLFSVKGTIFVLGVDRQQLLNSISGVYGVNLDSEGYIRKFIDWDFELPAPNYRQYNLFLFSTIFKFQERNSFIDTNNYTNGATSFLHIISFLADYKNLSLRDIEQFNTKLYLALQGNRNKQNIKHLGFVPIGVHLFLKMFYPTVFDEVTNINLKTHYNEGITEKFIEGVFEAEKIQQENQTGYSYYSITEFLIKLLSNNSYNFEDAKLCIGKKLSAEISKNKFEHYDVNSDDDPLMKHIIVNGQNNNLYNFTSRKKISKILYSLPATFQNQP